MFAYWPVLVNFQHGLFVWPDSRSNQWRHRKRRFVLGITREKLILNRYCQTTIMYRYPMHRYFWCFSCSLANHSRNRTQKWWSTGNYLAQGFGGKHLRCRWVCLKTLAVLFWCDKMLWTVFARRRMSRNDEIVRSEVPRWVFFVGYGRY